MLSVFDHGLLSVRSVAPVLRIFVHVPSITSYMNIIKIDLTLSMILFHGRFGGPPLDLVISFPRTATFEFSIPLREDKSTTVKCLGIPYPAPRMGRRMPGSSTLSTDFQDGIVPPALLFHFTWDFLDIDSRVLVC